MSESEPCPLCREPMHETYDDETGAYGWRCDECSLVIDAADMPAHPPLSDEDVNRMLDEEAHRG